MRLMFHGAGPRLVLVAPLPHAPYPFTEPRAVRWRNRTVKVIHSSYKQYTAMLWRELMAADRLRPSPSDESRAPSRTPDRRLDIVSGEQRNELQGTLCAGLKNRGAWGLPNQHPVPLPSPASAVSCERVTRGPDFLG